MKLPARVRLGLECWLLALAACAPHASTTPLGGVHQEDAALPPATSVAAADVGEAEGGDASAADDDDSARAGSAPATQSVPAGSAQAAAAAAVGAGQPASAGAFQVEPFAARQVWTRLLDMELSVKVGPSGGVDMKMVSHQEARFEVLAASNGELDRLQIEYVVFKSQLTIMGQTQDSPEELAGKRFVVSFNQGKPDVRDASGAAPPQKQSDTVQDDAREPLAMHQGLAELSGLAARGSGDFSRAAAVALAGGEDDDTKVPNARARLQKLGQGPRGEKLALIDLAYTLTNAIDEQTSMEVRVSGHLNVTDAPARFGSSSLSGPVELRSSNPDGMQGRGEIRLTTSYRY